MDYESALKAITKIKSAPVKLSVSVFGDFMLDIDSQVIFSDRNGIYTINPDHPPVMRPGGAGSVAMMLKALNCQVICCGAYGSSDEGDALAGLLGTGLRRGRGPAITKNRIFNGKRLLHRVDQDAGPRIADYDFGVCLNRIRESQAVVLVDHGKGSLKLDQMRSVIGLAAHWSVPMIVDPFPGHISNYLHDASNGQTGGKIEILKLNRAEIEKAGVRVNSLEHARHAIQGFHKLMPPVANMVLTMGRDGFVFDNGEQDVMPVVYQRPSENVVDEVGAGDMVTAVLTACRIYGVPVQQAMFLAVLAASMEVERNGAVPITLDDLEKECKSQLPKKDHAFVVRGEIDSCVRTIESHAESVAIDAATRQIIYRIKIGKANDPFESKILSTIGRLDVTAEEIRARGQRIVLANGCFDLLHLGHMHMLAEAAKMGTLIVLVDTDESIRSLSKGNGQRPIVSQDCRMRSLAYHAGVSYVMPFHTDNLAAIIGRIHPEILVKGSDTKDVACAKLVQRYGGQVVLVPVKYPYSTTELEELIITKFMSSTTPERKRPVSQEVG